MAKIASSINPLCGSGVYQIIDLARVVKAWREATALKYASSSHSWEELDFSGRVMDDMRNGREKMHCGPTSAKGGSAATVGEQSTGGKCRLVDGPASYLGAGLQIYPGIGGKQLGWKFAHSVR